MALRKYNAVRGGDSANHTSDGFIIPKTGEATDDGVVTVEVGNTTTLDCGEPATVTNSGTAEDLVLDFGIPKGTTVAVGNTTTLPPSSSATVTNGGTACEMVLNFGIPKGEKGADLLASQLNFTIHAESGDHSAAYISGSYPTFHIELVLERGQKGDAGNNGYCTCTCDCCNGGGGDEPPPPVNCPEGYHDDGFGNCVQDDVPP